MKDKIPIFKTWNEWYVLVIALLIVLIIFFIWVTKYFA